MSFQSVLDPALVTELKRGTETILPAGGLEEKLVLAAEQGRPLRIKAGFDPTAPDLHLGHTVLLNKMRQFQQAGHEVYFVIGDFTARIGDPTGKMVTRPPLSEEDIAANAKTYATQVFKILDPTKTRVVYNSTWTEPLGAAGLVKLAAQSTLARLLEREDFSTRFGAQQPISLHELLYPLLQGYDSVALVADIELGGTDQTFNLLMGRELQKQVGQSPQVVLTLPLLEGLDGVQKMSKSLGNTIAIEECPQDLFGKIMSLSDGLMWRYYELLSFRSGVEIEALKAAAAAGSNPRDIKMKLGEELVNRFHGSSAAREASERFVAQFRDKQIPADLATSIVKVPSEGIWLPHILKEVGLVHSTSEAVRQMQAGGVQVNQARVTDSKQLFCRGEVLLLQVGKRRFAKVALSE